MALQTPYDRIGAAYDATRRADPYLAGRVFSLLQPARGGLFLDVACGSGNYTTALAGMGVRIVGADQSATMVSAARRKAPGVPWCIADAGSLPFGDRRFDGAVCTLAIHHFKNVGAALAEIRRVLRGGRLVLLTATREQMRGYWLNAYFPLAMERSIAQMPDWLDVRSALLAAGFHDIRSEPYEVRPDLQDFFLYCGKHRPAIYLDARVRAGISTFSLLADPAEVQAGCASLSADIASGRIHEVMRACAHGGGDYLFVVGEAGAAKS